MHKILLIDFQNIIYRSIHSSHAMTLMKPDLDVYSSWQPIVDPLPVFREQLFGRLLDVVSFFSPDEVIVASDYVEGPTWRKLFYHGYKGSRKGKRDGTGIDFKKFFGMAKEVLKQFQTYLPNFKYVVIPGCEADDVIAVLAKNKSQDNKIIVFSSDGDFDQLIGGNIERWHIPLKGEKTITRAVAKLDIGVKVICGDDGDDIPNILIMGDMEYEGDKKVGCGPATAIQMLSEGLTADKFVKKVRKKYPNLTETTITETIKNNFLRNNTLINFELIPKEIETRVLEFYSSYQTGKYNPRILTMFLCSTGLSKTADNISRSHTNLMRIS